MTIGFPSDRRTPLGLGAKIGYALGAVVDGVTSNALNFFLMFYATMVCGLGGTKAGLALSIGLVVDAVADPFIGSTSDHCRSRLGRRLPFMLAGLPMTAVALVLIFSIPAGLSSSLTFALLLAASIALRVSISLFNLPYLALGAELSDDYGERSSIAAWRWGIGMIGGLLTVLIGFGLFFAGPGGTDRRAAYPGFALSSAVMMLVVAFGSIAVALALRGRAHAASEPQSGTVGTFLRDIGDAFRNRSFRVLFLATLLLFIGQGVTFTLSLHANTYFWKLSAPEIRNVALALFAGLLAGAPLIGPLASRYEKRTLLFVSLIGLIFSQVALVLLRLLGVLTLSGQLVAALLVANAVLAGLSITGAVIATSAMLADAADEHDLHTGRRSEGVLFAGWSFSSKAAGGLGALVAGIALDMAGFPAGGTVGTIALPASTVTGLGIASGPAAAFFSTCGLLVLLGYRLDRARHAEILAALTKQRLQPTVVPVAHP